MFKHFSRCNAAASDLYDGKSKNEIAVVFFPNSHGCWKDAGRRIIRKGAPILRFVNTLKQVNTCHTQYITSILQYITCQKKILANIKAKKTMFCGVKVHENLKTRYPFLEGAQ